VIGNLLSTSNLRTSSSTFSDVSLVFLLSLSLVLERLAQLSFGEDVSLLISGMVADVSAAKEISASPAEKQIPKIDVSTPNI
jgi:hypothetical protein